MTSDEVLVIRSDWPATTIGGEPGIVSGSLSLCADVDGSASLYLVIGAAGAPNEECEHVEFILSPEHADALAHALVGRPRNE
jgi:hypothetical protein